MSRLRDELSSYLSIPGSLCMVAGGWLYLAANHCNDEARRVSQAYVLDSLSGMLMLQYSILQCKIALFVACCVLGTLHDSNRKVCHLHVFLLHLCTDAKKLERLLPMLVALRGRVESNDPKKCELSDRKAVIHEVRQPAALHLAAQQLGCQYSWNVKGGTGSSVQYDGLKSSAATTCSWIPQQQTASAVVAARQATQLHFTKQSSHSPHTRHELLFPKGCAAGADPGCFKAHQCTLQQPVSRIDTLQHLHQHFLGKAILQVLAERHGGRDWV